MSKKAYIGIFAIVLSQAVYTTYLVRENVQHEKQMREQRIALFEQLFQLSKENRNTTIQETAPQPVQPVSSDENVSDRQIEQNDPVDDTPQINHLLDMAKEYEEAGAYEDAYLLSLKALEIDPDNQRAQWVSYKMKQAMDRDKEYTQLAKSAPQSVKRSANTRTNIPRQKKSSQKESSSMDEDEPKHLHGNSTTYIGVSPGYTPPNTVYYAAGYKEDSSEPSLSTPTTPETEEEKPEWDNLYELPSLPEDPELGNHEKMYAYRGSVGFFCLPPSVLGCYFDPDVNYIPEDMAFGDQNDKSHKTGEQYFQENQIDSTDKTLWHDNESMKIIYRYKPLGRSFCGAYLKLLADISEYGTITFMIKGENGGEQFQIGMNCNISNRREDAVFIGSINRFITGGKVTQDWQMAKINVSEFSGADVSNVISLFFDINEESSGKIWIDDFRFYRKSLYNTLEEANRSGCLLLDNFDFSYLNLLGKKTNTYKKLPSVCHHTLDEKVFYGECGKSLRIDYDKQETGWSGYYSMLNHSDGESFDLSKFNHVSFMVKGAKGGETFEIGMADRNWLVIDDFLKGGAVEDYLPGGVTTEWQEVVIPFSKVGALDLTAMGSFVINFNKKQKATIWIDELRFYRDTPPDLASNQQLNDKQDEISQEKIQSYDDRVSLSEPIEAYSHDDSQDEEKSISDQKQAELSLSTGKNERYSDREKDSSVIDEDRKKHLHGNKTTYVGVEDNIGQHKTLIDNFDKQGNEMGGRSSTYVQEPSGIFAGKDGDIKHGDSGKSLKLRYKKESQGGPYGKGGWCGYYTVIKGGPRTYFDASRYNYLTFWVKGDEGDENFKVGVADEAQEKREDSVKTEEIAVYLPDGKITTEWQQARIPLDEIFVDLSKLASIEICFESDCFPDGGGKGTVYIDDMYFEQ